MALSMAHNLFPIILTLMLCILEFAHANNNGIFDQIKSQNQLHSKDDDDGEDCESGEDDDDDCKGDSSSWTAWKIVGVVVGTVCLAILIICFILFFLRRKQRGGALGQSGLRAAAKETAPAPEVVMEMEHSPGLTSTSQSSSSNFIVTLPPPVPGQVPIASTNRVPEVLPIEIDPNYPYNPEFMGPMENIYEEPPPPYDFAVEAAIHQTQHELAKIPRIND